MGSRKSTRAEQLKEQKKQTAIAVLRDCPTSPLKMRIVADSIGSVTLDENIKAPADCVIEVRNR